MKYQTIPKTVDAILWDGDRKTLDTIKELLGDRTHVEYFNRCLFIGGFAVNTGEYIVIEGDQVYKMISEVFEQQFMPIPVCDLCEYGDDPYWPSDHCVMECKDYPKKKD